MLQKQQREERQRLTKELRNEERKRKRLRLRAKLLTGTDLLECLALRQDKQQRRGNTRGAVVSNEMLETKANDTDNLVDGERAEI